MERAAGGAVEGHEGLALVGDADGGDGGSGALLGEAAGQLGQGGSDGVPDLVGVVLHPARAGEVLGELAVHDVGDPGAGIDGEGPDAGGAGIDGDDDGGVGRHGQCGWGVRVTRGRR